MTGGALVVALLSRVSSRSSRALPVWDAEHVRYYLIGGLLGISLPYVLAFIVMHELEVGIVGLLTALSPVVTYAIARSLGIERGHPLRLAGLVVGLVGVSVLMLPQQDIALAGNGLYMLLALGIPVSLAASNIYRSRYWPVGSEAMPLVIGMLTVQGIWLFVVNLALGNFQQGLFVHGDAMYLLAFLGLLAGMSYMSSFNLLRVGGPVYLSQMGYVITAVTLLAGVLMWDERYDSHDILSMALILTGVLLTTLTQNSQGRTLKAVVPSDNT
jgi:drug/metabolite transporter (DMT)-like permease